MKTLTRIAFAPALAIAAIAPLTSAAMAGEGSEDIVVTSRAEMQEWQADTTRMLNRALQRSPQERSISMGSGIVKVSFSLNEKGRPTNVQVYSSTANWASERAARYAVRRLGDLSDVPVTNAENAKFLANIIFADDLDEHSEFQRELAQTERARLASGSAESEVITLGG